MFFWDLQVSCTKAELHLENKYWYKKISDTFKSDEQREGHGKLDWQKESSAT